jgi:hypothetical protein
LSKPDNNENFSINLSLLPFPFYPTFLAAISDYAHPDQHPKSIGILRLWRDKGYAIGAIVTA